jgi:hypothetical protein
MEGRRGGWTDGEEDGEEDGRKNTYTQGDGRKDRRME